MVAERKPNSFRSPWTEALWGLLLFDQLIDFLISVFLSSWNDGTDNLFDIIFDILFFPFLCLICWNGIGLLLVWLGVVIRPTINLFSSPNCKDGMTCLVFYYTFFVFLLYIAYSDSLIVPFYIKDFKMSSVSTHLTTDGLILKSISMSSIWSNEKKQLAYFRFELIVCLVLTMFLGVFNVFFLEQLPVHSLASSIFVAVTPVLALDILPLFVLIDLYALITRKAIIKPTPLASCPPVPSISL